MKMKTTFFTGDRPTCEFCRTEMDFDVGMNFYEIKNDEEEKVISHKDSFWICEHCLEDMGKIVDAVYDGVHCE